MSVISALNPFLRIGLALIGATAIWHSYLWWIPGNAPLWIDNPSATATGLVIFGGLVFIIGGLLQIFRRVERTPVETLADATLTDAYLIPFVLILGGADAILAPVIAILLRDALVVGLFFTRKPAPALTAETRGYAKVSDHILLGVIASGLLGVAFGVPEIPYLLEAWLSFLWIAAGLRLWTGWSIWTNRAA